MREALKKAKVGGGVARAGSSCLVGRLLVDMEIARQQIRGLFTKTFVVFFRDVFSKCLLDNISCIVLDCLARVARHTSLTQQKELSFDQHLPPSHRSGT